MIRHRNCDIEYLAAGAYNRAVGADNPFIHGDIRYARVVIPGLTRNPVSLWIPAFAGMTRSATTDDALYSRPLQHSPFMLSLSKHEDSFLGSVPGVAVPTAPLGKGRGPALGLRMTLTTRLGRW